jgi:heme-degrading monooxygenase HmoA
MIARMWRGTATAAKAADYRRHFTTNVVPHLKKLEGHEGSLLIQRNVDDQVEFVAITWWDSMETIKKFAGLRPGVAVVEPEAQAALSVFDDFVTHYEVAYRSECLWKPYDRRWLNPLQ